MSVSYVTDTRDISFTAAVCVHKQSMGFIASLSEASIHASLSSNHHLSLCMHACQLIPKAGQRKFNGRYVRSRRFGGSAGSVVFACPQSLSVSRGGFGSDYRQLQLTSL